MISTRQLACFIALFSIFLVISPTQAKSSGWFAMHPGGGGEVQNIVVDPYTPGRLFVLSDMEGLYRSDDFGRSWRIITKDVFHHNCHGLTVTPGDSNRLYLGTTRGAMQSYDAGESWSMIDLTLNNPVQTMAVDPKDTNYVYLAVSAADSQDLKQLKKQESTLFVSNDKGKTWRKANFAPGYTHSNNQVEFNTFSLSVHPTSQALYIGSTAGLVTSNDHGKTFSTLAHPSDAAQHCFGATLSPDGSTIYAVFLSKDGKRSQVYVSETDEISASSWRNVSHLGFDQSKSLPHPGETMVDWDGETYKESNRPELFCRPSMDPRSGNKAFGMDNTHRLLLVKTLKTHESSLWQSTFDLGQGLPDKGQWKRILAGAGRKGWTYDKGYDTYLQAGFPNYSGLAWGKDPMIYASIGQGVIEMKPNTPGFPKTAGITPLYTELVRTDHGMKMWKTRGWESTYNRDIVVHENFVAQTVADHGLYLSWDHGVSWSTARTPGGSEQWASPLSSGYGLALVPGKTPMILMGIGKGYGGMDTPVGLYAMKLNTHSPKDKWKLIAAGDGSKRLSQGKRNAGGLPSPPPNMKWKLIYRYSSIAVDPVKPQRVFVGTQEAGVYVCEDIVSLYETGKPHFQKVDLQRTKVKMGDGTALVTHPTKETVFYCINQGDKEVLIGYRPGAPNVPWKIHTFARTPGTPTDVFVWQHGDTTYHAVSYHNAKTKSDEVMVSADDGKNWTTVMNRAYMDKHAPTSFYNTKSFGKEQVFGMQGICGYKDKLYIPVGTVRTGFAMYKVALKPTDSGVSHTVKDWRGETPNQHGWHPYPRVVEGKVLMLKGKPHVIQATRGAGTFARAIED